MEPARRQRTSRLELLTSAGEQLADRGGRDDERKRRGLHEPGDRGAAAVEHAKRSRIHTFIATSDIHLKHKLMMSRQEVVDAAGWAIGYAKKRLDYIEFSAEDASRSDPDYLVTVFGEVIRAGAVTLNVPDTTGYALPEQTAALFRLLFSGAALEVLQATFGLFGSFTSQ